MFRIHNLSESLVDSLLVQFEDKKEYREIYEYSMEIVLSTIINLVISIFLAKIFGIESNVFWYMIFFLPYRFLFGGAHAKTHVRCITGFAVCMLTCIYVARIIPATGGMIALELVMVVMANVSDCHYGEKASLRKGIICSIATIIVLLYLNFIVKSYTNGLCATFGFMSQALLLFMKNKR